MSRKVLEDILTPQLQELREKGLYNDIDTVEGANGPIVVINGKEIINMSSNNYLGLANNERLIQKANEATKQYGVGAGAVRTINGTMTIHTELEKEIAEFKHTEAAIAFQSGFNCNMGAISAVMTKKDAIISDELNHASIIDGCRLSGAKIIRVKHQDMDDLRRAAKEAVESCAYEKIMYITDGVFQWMEMWRSFRKSWRSQKNMDCLHILTTHMVQASWAMVPARLNILAFPIKLIFKLERFPRPLVL